MNMAHKSKSDKNMLHLIGEIFGVPNTIIDAAIHDLREKINTDPEYKEIKEWLDTLPKI